jgi:hypothetical protein
VDEGIHPARFLGGQILRDVKPPDLAGDLRAEAAGSKREIRVMPDFPAMMLAQASGTPIPTGETMPRPVTTTLRLDKLAPVRVLGQDLTWALM